MSVGLSESQNYIWSDDDCLGEGTFGKVFRGIQKRSGDKVAIKIFKHVNHQVSQETKLLQSLQHKHIIRFFATEFELSTNKMVMILELCNGGSLMSYLNEPENVCGLPDEEFLLVFNHLSAGLEFLKRHDVIHRDVKPDNIMRHVLDDGQTVYKLADFGTARELPEGQNFTSLHGTEPYLHPQLYRVCFFQGSNCTREFGANTDLWSIGVTLYQTATGNLPFLVMDRHVMLRIYHEMQENEGIVSAIQQKNSDEVVFQKKLPRNCRLSCGLKQLITPIIAGVFIQEKGKQWSFTQYYEQVVDLVSRKVINVFYVNKMRLMKVYIKSDETFNTFKYYVSAQSEVAEENQVFLYKANLIVNTFEDFSGVDESDCIFLFDRSNAEVESTIDVQLVFENLTNFPNKFMSSSESDDHRLAFVTCRDLCLCKNVMDYQSIVYKYFSNFIKDFNSYCKEETRDQRKMYDTLLEKSSQTKNRAQILKQLQNLNHSNDDSFLDRFEEISDNFLSETDKLFNDLRNIKADLVPNTSHDSYLKTVSKELTDMKQLRKKLYNARINKKLYDFEKIKIVHCVRTILETFTDKMDPNFDCFVNDIKNWHKNEFFAHVRTLSTLKKLLNRYRSDLKRFEDEIQARSDDNLKTISTLGLNKEKLFDIVEKYKTNNLDIKTLVEENLKLVEQMNELVVTLNSNLSTDL
ncbi:Serine/threonine-protein kinase TBK1-like Protein [Tribolium castaneum]|uniref:Serine/threonine-protein kinase TBK1-like Protein n=1 Tax=Tribolium castaneum TaxID=7070 RepID=D6WPQ5_TRICA|nr:PREDICTED: serine/threonine-protein kinase TBK1 [Tribolium castaneum]EFA06854.1 Serine/threonine-protein kinase TBK1-like Protein [Tribolium castaneum]|eukprot:XP_015837643.1 PREDICTED: serine/threonine-protein kinase TBK1 [Tribolium castaneum]